MMKSLLLALAAVPLCVFASDQAPKCDAEGGQACFEAAIEYHRAQAYDKAILCAEKSCMEGHGGGCFYLGFARQQKGEHAQSNPFYEKACSAGYAAGCLSLGNNYRLGLGAEVSEEKSRAYYQRACDLGEELGCSHLKPHAGSMH